tara:strand:- start:91 stop:300 length:210 start_codon:yes stop_codon:yes gene_type:complete
MNQQTEMLQHDAQLILSLFGDAQAQKRRLLTIEKQLKGEGVDIQQLHRRIDDLSQVQDIEQYRCRYQPC